MSCAYKLHITFSKPKRSIERTVHAETFNQAVLKSREKYKTWLKKGVRIKIFNPGENNDVLPEANFIG